jgi:hypothetical protein
MWGSLPLIECIELAHTRWQPLPVGSWPASWGKMTSLKWLDLSSSAGYTAIITGEQVGALDYGNCTPHDICMLAGWQLYSSTNVCLLGQHSQANQQFEGEACACF